MANGNDPANIPYIIVENGFYYVAYKEKVKVPEVVVSAKGVANGLSEEYNDGWDFGPDSYSPTSTSAIPYTETSGTQEAWNYAAAQGEQTIVFSASHGIVTPFQINTDILVPNPTPHGVSIRLVGQGRTGGTILQFNSGCNKGIDYGANFNGNFSGNVQIENLALWANTSTLTSLINVPSTTNGGYVSLRDVQYGGPVAPAYTDAAIYISGVFFVSLIGVSDEMGQGKNGITVINAEMCWMTDYRGAGAIVTLQGNTYTFLSIKSATSIILQANIYTYITGNYAGGSTITCNDTNSIIVLSGYFGLANITPVIISSGATVDILSLRDAILSASVTDLPFVTNNGTLTYFDKKNVIFDSTDAESIVFPTNSPTLSANPPASATVYQNTNPYDIEIDLPVYATTAGTAGYVTIAKGATSTPTAIGNQYVSGDTSDTSEQIIRLRVPANWYYEFTASGVTFGTASVFAD